MYLDLQTFSGKLLYKINIVFIDGDAALHYSSFVIFYVFIYIWYKLLKATANFEPFTIAKYSTNHSLEVDFS